MFKKARWKLTGWYLLIIMIISISFSTIIFGMMNQEMERFVRSPRFRWEMLNPKEVEMTLNEGRARLIWSLLGINGIILVISGTLGYVLAGKTLSPIQSMLEEQKRFVGDASHELRTPLTALKSMLEVGLRDKKMNIKEARKLISESIEETDNLKNLSDSLLELARENGNKIIFEKVKIKEIALSAIKKTENKALRKKIKIVAKINESTARGNRDKLTEVLVILLDNAIKYSPKNSQIHILAKEGQKQTTIRVIDEGIGIEEKDISHIFERFYRADKARSHLREKGYGLGLSIAKKIIEEHEGKILVKSESGAGSEFKITLPNFS